MDIPADTTISEAGPGQFEVNLMHQPDALKAADDAWFFKLLVKGLAREHGVAASFMAKPYEDYAGNGPACAFLDPRQRRREHLRRTPRAAPTFSAMPSPGASRRCPAPR
jgi:glutamine synthetase type III